MSAAYRIAFRDWFGLWRSSADVLASLYEAQGEARSPAELARSARVAEGAVHFHIHKVRAVLESDAIATDTGCGYRLTPEGLAECSAVLKALAEEFARAP